MQADPLGQRVDFLPYIFHAKRPSLARLRETKYMLDRLAANVHQREESRLVAQIVFGYVLVHRLRVLRDVIGMNAQNGFV